MKKVICPAIFVLATIFSHAQTVFSVDYANQAEVKVYVVKYDNQADLRV
jgi:hypothetical protein